MQFLWRKVSGNEENSTYHARWSANFNYRCSKQTHEHAAMTLQTHNAFWQNMYKNRTKTTVASKSNRNYTKVEEQIANNKLVEKRFAMTVQFNASRKCFKMSIQVSKKVGKIEGGGGGGEGEGRKEKCRNSHHSFECFLKLKTRFSRSLIEFFVDLFPSSIPLLTNNQKYNHPTKKRILQKTPQMSERPVVIWMQRHSLNGWHVAEHKNA